MPPPEGQPRIHGLRRTGIIAGVVALAIVAYGVFTRASESARLRDWTEAQAVPVVAVEAPKHVTNAAGLELPGRLEAYTRASIYARVNGYVKSWRRDIGAHVRAGEELAIIDTPDIDQQLERARADLVVANANAELARTTATRWQALAGTDAVSQQDVDQRTSAFNASLAQVKAAQAAVDGLVVQKGYARIVAPFGGTVTRRDTDVGALINSGSGSGPELFEVSDTTKLRVYVSVPQTSVPGVQPGTKATITVPERPGKTYAAAVEASAQAVNSQSGTTLMQLLVDNRNGELLPGGYANVRIDLAGPANALTVPSSALVFNARGLAIATVGEGSKVQMKPVIVARDLGQLVEIASGLAATDQVIVNPPDGILDGAPVRVAEPVKPKAADGVKRGLGR